MLTLINDIDNSKWMPRVRTLVLLDARRIGSSLFIDLSKGFITKTTYISFRTGNPFCDTTSITV